MLGEVFQRDLQNVTVSSRRDRQSPLAVKQIKCSLLKTQLQLAALKNAPILVAQNWQKNLVAQIKLQRMPVDVEIGGVSGAGPVFEHIHPPRIQRLGDSDVVRDKVEHLPHRVRMQFFDPGVIIGARTDCRV